MLLRGRGGKHFCAELRTVCKGFSSLIMIANFGFGFGFEIVVCFLLLVFFYPPYFSWCVKSVSLKFGRL